MHNIRYCVKRAQESLRATKINWQEACLFDADEYLSEAIRLLDEAAAQQSVQRTAETVRDDSDPRQIDYERKNKRGATRRR